MCHGGPQVGESEEKEKKVGRRRGSLDGLYATDMFIVTNETRTAAWNPIRGSERDFESIRPRQRRIVQIFRKIFEDMTILWCSELEEFEIQFMSK